jgi:nucleotide-binding universal stress UspA family protein
MNPSKKILVPTDFGEYAENALLHALDAAKSWGASIDLVHFSNLDTNEDEAVEKLDALASKYADHEVTIIGHCIPGNVMDIGQIAAEREANFIFLGTSGPKGWENLFGARALKVCYQSPVPVIVTHLSPIPRKVHVVAVPVDKDVADKQILNQILRIGRFWKCEVVLIGAGYNDPGNKSRVHQNLQFAEKYLRSADIRHEVEMTDSESDYTDQLLKICRNKEANLIAFVAHKGTGIFNFGTSGFDEKLLTNPLKIPLLISTPNETLSRVDVFHVYQ